MIKSAISEGRALSQADVDRVMDAHKAKATGYRGKVVARTEAFTAQATGRSEGYRQLIDSGKVEAVTKKWVHGLSLNAREDHRRMDGEVIGFDELFVMDDGARMRFPHDPNVGVQHSINCRCTVFYRTITAKD